MTDILYRKVLQSFSFLLPLILFSCNCAKSPYNRPVGKDLPGMISLIQDVNFEKGLALKGHDSSHPYTGEALFPFGQKSADPDWILAEWMSQYLVHPIDMVDNGPEKIFQNQGKRVSFLQEENSTRVRMELFASAEYDSPRRAGEGWPHLLIEQDFDPKPLLTDIESLDFSMEGRLMHCSLKMPETAYDPGLHTAQYQLFLSIQDLNTASPGYGDYLWFGIPFYDYRYETIPVYAAEDGGKEDATGKYIYIIGTGNFVKESFGAGGWKKAELNLKPHILEGLRLAKERGFLRNSALENFRVAGMNMGWEVPGTFDAGFEFRKPELIARLKDKDETFPPRE